MTKLVEQKTCLRLYSSDMKALRGTPMMEKLYSNRLSVVFESKWAGANVEVEQLEQFVQAIDRVCEHPYHVSCNAVEHKDELEKFGILNLSAAGKKVTMGLYFYSPKDKCLVGDLVDELFRRFDGDVSRISELVGTL